MDVKQIETAATSAFGNDESKLEKAFLRLAKQDELAEIDFAIAQENQTFADKQTEHQLTLDILNEQRQAKVSEIAALTKEII